MVGLEALISTGYYQIRVFGVYAWQPRHFLLGVLATAQIAVDFLENYPTTEFAGSKGPH